MFSYFQSVEKDKTERMVGWLVAQANAEGIEEKKPLEDALHLYIKSFIPVVYSDRPMTSKLGMKFVVSSSNLFFIENALQHLSRPRSQTNHAYLKVFASGVLGFKKWITMVELCTNLTAYLFLLALVSHSRNTLFSFTCYDQNFWYSLLKFIRS